MRRGTYLKYLSPLGKSSAFLGKGWGWGKVANHSAMSWTESGSKILAIAHGRVRDDVKGWGGKHVVTNGVAWHPISHTGAAQSGACSQRQPN